MVIEMTALGAIVAIITGVLVAKPFLIYMGIGLFLLGFLGISAIFDLPWVIIFVIVIVIISRVLKK